MRNGALFNNGFARRWKIKIYVTIDLAKGEAATKGGYAAFIG
jgi:hypothetical protein